MNGQEETLNQSITLTQLWLAVAFPASLSLAGLVITGLSVLSSNARITDLGLSTNARITDLKTDITHLSGRIDTLIGVVNDIDKRLSRIEK